MPNLDFKVRNGACLIARRNDSDLGSTTVLPGASPSSISGLLAPAVTSLITMKGLN